MATLQESLKIIAEFQDNASAGLKRLADSLLGITADMNKANAAATNATASFNKIGAGANQAAGNLDKVAHANAGVTRELLVLAHELSQGSFQRFGGSLLVLGERMDILGKSVALLASPIGIAATAIAAGLAAVGVAFYQASAATKEFNAALALTNNFAGVTRDNIKLMATDLSARLPLSVGAATETLLGLARTGVFTKEQIGGLGKIIEKDSLLGAGSIEELTKAYAKLPEGPTKFMESVNRTRNVFTPAIQEQIKKLEETGHTQEAVNLTLKALTDYQNGPAKDAIKSQIGLWKELTSALGDMWQAFKIGIGAEKLPLQTQLEGVNKELDKLIANGGRKAQTTFDALGNVTGEAVDPRFQELLDKRKAILKQLAAEQKKTITDANAAFLSKTYQEASADFDAIGVKTANGLEKALEKFRKNVRDIRVTNPNDERLNPETLRQAEAAIRAKYINTQDNEVARQAYAAALANLDGYLAQAKSKYALQAQEVKISLTKGTITEEEAAKQTLDIRKAELEEERKILLQKIALADKEAKRSANRDGVKDREKFAADIKKIQSDELLATAEYEKELAKHSEEIAKIYNKMVLDAQKQSADRERAFNREQNKATLSPNEAALADAQNAVQDRFIAMRERTAEEYRIRKASAAELKAAMDELDREEADQLAKETEYSQKRIATQQDWKTGAIKAIKDYQEAANNLAEKAKTFVDNITKGIEDTIYDIATTGKFSLKKLEDAFTQTLTRMVAQALAANLQKAIFGSLLGTGGSGSGGGLVGTAGSFLAGLFGGGKELGGDVNAGVPYIVGEKRPELFIPRQSGTIVPNLNELGGAGNTLNLSITAMDSQSVIQALDKVKKKAASMMGHTKSYYNLQGS